MSNNEMTLQGTLKLDEEWSSHQTRDELIESIRARLDSSLGFRGRTEKLKVVDKRPKAYLRVASDNAYSRLASQTIICSLAANGP